MAGLKISISKDTRKSTQNLAKQRQYCFKKTKVIFSFLHRRAKARSALCC